MVTFADFGSSFVLGLLTPLTAVCVLPLYPGFLSYLASHIGVEGEESKYRPFFLDCWSFLVLFLLCCCWGCCLQRSFKFL